VIPNVAPFLFICIQIYWNSNFLSPTLFSHISSTWAKVYLFIKFLLAVENAIFLFYCYFLFFLELKNTPKFEDHQFIKGNPQLKYLDPPSKGELVKCCSLVVRSTDSLITTNSSRAMSICACFFSGWFIAGRVQGRTVYFPYGSDSYPIISWEAFIPKNNKQSITLQYLRSCFSYSICIIYLSISIECRNINCRASKRRDPGI
jgi:hypothetical protein